MDTNFYSLIDCNIESTIEEIKNGYKNKINKYISDNNNSSFNQDIKNEIKLLKMAKYILTNKILRKKYDALLLNSENSTASRKDFKLSFSEKNDILSNRIFEQYNY